MKSAVALLCVWAVALAVSVHAQSCPLTAQDFSGLDYTQVNSGCGEFQCVYVAAARCGSPSCMGRSRVVPRLPSSNPSFPLFLFTAGLNNPPSASICDSCTAALLVAFSPTYPKFGLTSANPPANPTAFTNALQNAVQECATVAYPVLSQKITTVPVTALLDLRSCPTTPGPEVTAAYQQVFPNAPVQANSG